MTIKEMLRCGICGQRAEAESMRFDNKKQINICPKCYEKQKSPANAEPRVMSQLAKRAIEAEVQGKKVEEKVSYKCNSCSYIFTRGVTYDKTCPYCGKKGTVTRREDVGAEEI